jgi:hypothetical protein
MAAIEWTLATLDCVVFVVQIASPCTVPLQNCDLREFLGITQQDVPVSPDTPTTPARAPDQAANAFLSPLARGVGTSTRGACYLNARDSCLIAPFSKDTTPFGAELLLNSATKARAISSCSIVPNGPGIRRPSQAA